MTSTQGNKKSNCLDKHENDLIKPNEYTLDLFVLTLFYVDILDSQLSAKNISTGHHWHENYHTIQITSI